MNPVRGIETLSSKQKPTWLGVAFKLMNPVRGIETSNLSM